MAMSRTQRCGHCEGCLAKACGTCVYCKDNPQYGGPGVKKQSCVARRCTRVLEGKLQREANGLRAKTGCGYCDECRQLDCGACLICLDKRFFRGRFLPNALCAKKKCSNARSLDVSPRHTPSPKYAGFKSKHELALSQLHNNNNNNNICPLNGNSLVNNSSSSSSSFLMRKRLMSDELLTTSSSNGFVMMKRAKKLSDSGVSLTAAHHQAHVSPYSNLFSTAPYHSTVNNNNNNSSNNNNNNSNNFDLSSLVMQQHQQQPSRQAMINHPGVNGTTAVPQAAAAYQSSSTNNPMSSIQQNGYNGSPPAGTVAPAPSSSVSVAEFNAYLQTATQVNGAASGQEASSPYHHNHYHLNATTISLYPTATATDNVYNLYCSPSVGSNNNRLTASSCSAQQSTSTSFQTPLQPPPYQWPSSGTSCGKVLFPATAADHAMHNRHHSFDAAIAGTNNNNNINNNNNNSNNSNNNNNNNNHHNALGEHMMLRDRLSAVVLPPLNSLHHHNHNSNNNSSSNSNNNNQLLQTTTDPEKQLKFVQLCHRPDNKSHQFYTASHSHYQHHVTNEVIYQQQQQQMLSSPGAIVTEQPMGPMDQQKVILQQL